MRHEIEIDKDEFAGAVLGDVRDNLGDRFVKRFFAPSRGDHAKITAVYAAARGLENVVRQKVRAGQQIAAWERPAADLEAGRLIVAWLHFIDAEVMQQLRPRILGVTDHD